LQTEIIHPQTHISHFTYSLLLHYLENATAYTNYTSSQKLLNKLSACMQ